MGVRTAFRKRFSRNWYQFKLPSIKSIRSSFKSAWDFLRDESQTGEGKSVGPITRYALDKYLKPVRSDVIAIFLSVTIIIAVAAAVGGYLLAKQKAKAKKGGKKK